jgi:hypothetical protein
METGLPQQSPADSGASRRPAPVEWRPVYVIQGLFFLIALIHLNGPFISSHYVRQNHTFDIAQHVYHEGWSAVVTPKFGFSTMDNPSQPYTVVHLEVPFHGLFGWPAAVVFKQYERAIARLVSIVFSLLSIRWAYGVLRHWLESFPSLVGTALWATAPLILHFGQVPMPDILATTGMIAAFAYALRGNLIASSAWFLFMLLAKMTVMIYGLPILTALLLARGCRSIRPLVSTALAWGIVPLLGLATWIALSRHDPPGSWVIVGGVQAGDRSMLHLRDLFNLKFLRFPVVCLFLFGGGILGGLGLLAAPWNSAARMHPWLKGAIALSIISNYGLERIAWEEPQYSLPVLFWVIVAASFGVRPLLDKLGRTLAGRSALGLATALHVIIATVSVVFLKAPRVTNLGDMEAASRLIPTEARVLVWACVPPACPSVWLAHNTIGFDKCGYPTPWPPDDFLRTVHDLQPLGFTYLVVFDLQERHSVYWNRSLLHVPYETDFADPASPFRAWCDARFHKLFDGNRVALYWLP